MTNPYPEHERMKTLRVEKRINAIADYLETCEAIGLPYDRARRDVAIEHLTSGTDDELKAFFAWTDKAMNRTGGVYAQLPGVFAFEPHDDVLPPSEQLFAAYLGIDLNVIEAERRVMLDELRAGQS